MRIFDEIEPDPDVRKATKLRDREASLRFQVEACTRGRQEDADVPVDAFELSRSLRSRWDGADYMTKHSLPQPFVFEADLFFDLGNRAE